MTCTPTSTPGCGSRRSPPTRRMHLTSPTAPPGSPRRCVAPASRWSRSGRSADAGAPVALGYGHHAVQPVHPPELWAPPPFEPTRVDGPDGPELHARGAIDDKGNVAFHLLG